MTKKNFTTGLDNLIQSSKDNIEKEHFSDKEKNKSPYQKATYYFNSENLNRIKAIAFFDRKPIGEVIDLALTNYITQYKNIEDAVKEYEARQRQRKH